MITSSVKIPNFCKPIIKLFIADIRIPAAILSFVLVYWVIFLRQTINLDGIFYFRIAELLHHGKWNEAYNLYAWLFYPSLITLVNKVFGIGLINSAYLLTASFSAVLTYVFITLVRDLGGDKKTLLVAAFVFVFYPELNESKYQICRDQGYWAFYLLSILFFVRYYFNSRWQYAFAWSIFMLIAILFRIEGIVFLILLPCVLFFKKGCSFVTKLQLVIRAHTVSLISVFFFFTFYVLRSESFYALGNPAIGFFSRLDLSLDIVAEKISQQTELVETTILNNRSDEYAIIVVLIIPVILLLANLFKSTTIPYSILLLCAFFTRDNFLKRESVPILTWTISLNVIILLFFPLTSGFLQARYTYPLVFSLLIILSFFLVFLHDKFLEIRSISVKQSVTFYLVLILLVFNSLEGVVAMPGMSKQYIEEAGVWLKDNMAQGDNLCTNNVKIIFYSGNFSTLADETKSFREDVSKEWLEKIAQEHCDYYAVWVKHDSTVSLGEIYSILGSNPIEKFKNKKNDGVFIYQTNLIK